MQAYSDPSREDEPHTLPNIQVFVVTADQFINAHKDSWLYEMVTNTISAMTVENPHYTDEEIQGASRGLAGWYWWSCFPGCLPDSDPIGPFNTSELALADAQAD